MSGTQAQTTTTTTVQTNTRIQETTDYSIFKALPHNRPVVHSHVIRLVGSMSERPHLRPARPVLVNDKMQIIDGQHRLKASELNGQSVFFMQVPNLTIEDARLLNALQRTWSLLDYAYSYASSKIPAYVQFVRTYEARELPPSAILEYMMPANRRQHQFRIGKLAPADQVILDQKLDEAADILAAFPKSAAAYVVTTAFMAVQKTEDYNHGRMLAKLSRAKLQAQPDRVSYIRELERAYNTDVPFNGPSYLRFF